MSESVPRRGRRLPRVTLPTPVAPPPIPEPRGRGDARRRATRLAAVQVLYQLEMTGEEPLVAADTYVRRYGAADPEPESQEEGALATADPARLAQIVAGAWGARGTLDQTIGAKLTTSRGLAGTDAILRALLRAGAWEVLEPGRKDIAARLIQDYLAVADAFFTGPEPKIVNAVLDRLARDTPAAAPGAAAGQDDLIPSLAEDDEPG